MLASGTAVLQHLNRIVYKREVYYLNKYSLPRFSGRETERIRDDEADMWLAISLER